MLQKYALSEYQEIRQRVNVEVSRIIFEEVTKEEKCFVWMEEFDAQQTKDKLYHKSETYHE